MVSKISFERLVIQVKKEGESYRGREVHVQKVRSNLGHDILRSCVTELCRL